MIKMVLKRLGQTILSLVVVATIIFFMFRLMPGDPTAAVVDPSISTEAREAMIQRLGLDQPLYQQYFSFLSDAVRGDLGRSFYYRRPVMEVIGDKVINTLMLMLSAMLIAYVIGILVGAYLAWKRGSKKEATLISIALTFRSAPTFWVGMLFIMFFSFRLGWFPHSGMRSSGYEAANTFEVFFSLDFLRHLFLPAVVAGLYFLATPLLMMRNTMLEVLGEDFIEMCHAKGLKEKVILYRHAARNALLPVVTTGALFLGQAIGGQVLIEYVFGWPGLGTEIIQAAQRHDYPLAQASFLLIALMVMIMNFLADLLYSYLDPRITYK
ncbi:ABC transporter permease [Natroniella sulfidigena]|uniref:ABC transporter permease n=1 Tax=Natroniella sulfidigena TaxID=723921 RepID=UPI00200B7AF7|nr:ABC transporter permease [Natroniella sulfidigena]MCK8815768.1 ABC transporter permease [Natroniella sulfidigena]